mgnify:CR=1 FL=1
MGSLGLLQLFIGCQQLLVLRELDEGQIGRRQPVFGHEGLDFHDGGRLLGHDITLSLCKKRAGTANQFLKPVVAQRRRWSWCLFGPLGVSALCRR